MGRIGGGMDGAWDWKAALDALPRWGGEGREVHGWGAVRRALDDVRRGPPVAVTVYRHAETTHNGRGLVTGASDVDLSDAGRAAAAALGTGLPEGPCLVACSGLRRSRETAAIALRASPATRASLLVDARLNEVSLGELEGGPRVRVDAYARGDVDHAPSGGETYRQAARRILSGFADALRAARAVPGAPPVVVFAHAGAMRVLSTLDGGDWTPAAMFALSQPNGHALRLWSGTMGVGFWQDRPAPPGGRQPIG